jgi:release factor glutamine methyltransferase
MTAQAALVAGVRRLREAGVPDPARDARWLLAHAMGIAPDRLTLHLPDDLPPEAAARFGAALDRRCKRQPVSQITGTRLFLGRAFNVTPDVLDPRPETETLVLAALEQPFSRVLDLGTGSGCILLSLLAENPAATGLGVDLSEAALKVAERNAKVLGVADRANLCQSDWFHAVTDTFDLIVSNPPYIDDAVWQTLDPEPRLWEPKTALTPGPDGLAPYRLIAERAPAHLAPGGRLLVEIGYDQGPSVATLFQTAGFADVAILPDMDGRDRCVRGIWTGETLQK